MSDGAISTRVAQVRARVASATERAGRDRGSVKVVGVSKGAPLSALREAAAAGMDVFGENRVQEALGKMDALHQADACATWAWHLVGRLQTNKVRAAVGRFALIHSVDAARVGTAIDEAAARMGLRQAVLVQVNLGEEAQKGGVRPADLGGLLKALAACRHLDILGLMTIPPAAEDPEASRPFFRTLRRLGTQMQAELGLALSEYSMGMSHDFEVAVAEGATMVRVGTAIFGPRSVGGAVGRPAT